MQLDLLAERDHADDGRGAAGRQHRERLFGGFLAAEHLERMMHPATREIAHLLHHIAVAGIDDIGGAELCRQLQLGRIGVDRDDAAGTAISAPLIAAMPTPPQPITATFSPGVTLAVFTTAPNPVMTPQPINAASSSGMSLRILTMAFSCTSICSANDDRLRN